ncbi:hypothetical protein C7Y47_24195 [Lysinibacillus sphaericus]|uniref:Uncharacterized protein n=1 Tax=Lysinibacillus sphaericus TaxID=1421 RepID=A0A544U7A5_LYSSH|nr:AroM family protein [Lysinibacillus sp. SDF0037]TQR26836.1 hypothetical protein C7Y47_24195 [Lysinibacillus sp. SDF0037]
MNKVGFLTQSSHSDITPTFKEIFHKDIEIVERGALTSLNEFNYPIRSTLKSSKRFRIISQLPDDYGNFEAAARYFKDYRVDLIILDCMGCNEERKENGILTILPPILINQRI